LRSALMRRPGFLLAWVAREACRGQHEYAGQLPQRVIEEHNTSSFREPKGRNGPWSLNTVGFIHKTLQFPSSHHAGKRHLGLLGAQGTSNERSHGRGCRQAVWVVCDISSPLRPIALEPAEVRQDHGVLWWHRDCSG
jgi:hypothetical protein